MFILQDYLDSHETDENLGILVRMPPAAGCCGLFGYLYLEREMNAFHTPTSTAPLRDSARHERSGRSEIVAGTGRHRR